jgi:hypothetical protein
VSLNEEFFEFLLAEKRLKKSLQIIWKFEKLFISLQCERNVHEG